jgi:hypothetical protein
MQSRYPLSRDASALAAVCAQHAAIYRRTADQRYYWIARLEPGDDDIYI